MEDFSSYDLIIDARSEREYEEDHIPGAINLPVINNDEYAEVGTTHRDDKHQAYLIGVAYSHRNIANHIDQVIGYRQVKPCKPNRARVLPATALGCFDRLDGLRSDYIGPSNQAR